MLFYVNELQAEVCKYVFSLLYKELLPNALHTFKHRQFINVYYITLRKVERLFLLSRRMRTLERGAVTRILS